MMSGYGTGNNSLQNSPGIRKDPYLGYNFRVEIEGLTAGGFMEVSGLSVETTVERKMFGGDNNTEYKFITATKSPDLTLKRGLTDFDQLWNWYLDVTWGKIVRKNGSIYLLDHQGLPVIHWNFTGAYPIKWDGPSFNAASGTVATETLILTHHGLTRPSGS